MKSRKTKILVTAFILTGGAGIILGNHLITANAIASGFTEESAVIMPADFYSAGVPTDVGLYENNDGDAYMLAATDNNKATDPSDDIVSRSRGRNTANPTDGNYSEDEARQMGIDAIIKEYGLTPADMDKFDVNVYGAYAIDANEDGTIPENAVADHLGWQVTAYPKNQADYPAIFRYGASIDDREQMLSHTFVNYNYVEGTPTADEVQLDQAEEDGIAAIVNKFALTEETLNRFTITTTYYEMNPYFPGKHVYWIYLYPEIPEEYSEIGCYGAYLDAGTGQVLRLDSAADGVG